MFTEVFVGLTATEYFTFEDSEIVTVSIESSRPANTSITVILQLLPESASGIVHVLQTDTFWSI